MLVLFSLAVGVEEAASWKRMTWSWLRDYRRNATVINNNDNDDDDDDDDDGDIMIIVTYTYYDGATVAGTEKRNGEPTPNSCSGFLFSLHYENKSKKKKKKKKKFTHSYFQTNW